MRRRRKIKLLAAPAHACEKEFFYVKFATPKQK